MKPASKRRLAIATGAIGIASIGYGALESNAGSRFEAAFEITPEDNQETDSKQESTSTRAPIDSMIGLVGGAVLIAAAYRIAPEYRDS